MVITEEKERSLLMFDFSKVTGPLHNIILIFVVENHLCMDKIFDYLFTSAIFEKLWPSCIYSETFRVVMGQWIVMKLKCGSLINIETSYNSETYKADYGVNP